MEQPPGGSLFDVAGVWPGDRVLDVGCGTGVITSALAERGRVAVGIDASQRYLDGARRLRSQPGGTYELGDARHMTYRDAASTPAYPRSPSTSSRKWIRSWRRCDG